MQIISENSVVAGGPGRSKIIISIPDASDKEAVLGNLFIMTGINF